MRSTDFFTSWASIVISGDQMRDLRRAFNVKTVDGVLNHSIGIGDPLMLPQMFKPGFHQKYFHHSTLVGNIFINAPAKGAVAPSPFSKFFEGSQKTFAIFG